MVMSPFDKPKHVGGVTLNPVIVETGGAITQTVCVIVQPLASVILASQLQPGAIFVAIVPVGVPGKFQTTLYAGVPPPKITVADPLGIPQVAGDAVNVEVNADGSIILKVAFIEQEFASVTVTEYPPATNPFSVGADPEGNHV